MSKFTHEHKEQESVRESSDWYSAEIGDYDVLLVKDENVARLSICPRNWNNGARLGILQCHPKSVGELERFAETASDLLRSIAQELREAGLDDLRGRFDIIQDELDERLNALAGDRQ